MRPSLPPIAGRGAHRRSSRACTTRWSARSWNLRRIQDLPPGVATMSIRSTYALDTETSQTIKRLAREWQVSQAEVIRPLGTPGGSATQSRRAVAGRRDRPLSLSTVAKNPGRNAASCTCVAFAAPSGRCPPGTFAAIMIHFDTNALIALPLWARAGHPAVTRIVEGEPCAVCAVVCMIF